MIQNSPMITDKIKNILADKHLSPSKFADEIGIQRSSISHILSGRNKPSLDIIQKIVKRFPELGLEWILEEELPDPIPSEERSSKTLGKAATGGTEKCIISTDATLPFSAPVNTDNQEKKIEKILIFYTDKTFTEYKPE